MHQVRVGRDLSYLDPSQLAIGTSISRLSVRSSLPRDNIGTHPAYMQLELFPLTFSSVGVGGFLGLQGSVRHGRRRETREVGRASQEGLAPLCLARGRVTSLRCRCAVVARTREAAAQ